jgi:RNA polymerase sigma factor for flagellar operon FliA
MNTQAVSVYEDGGSVRERLFTENMHVVRIIAFMETKKLPAHIDVDDLISAGMIGLLDAMDKFDVSKGASFKTYASIRIRGAIKDELRKMDWMSRSMRDKSNRMRKMYDKINMDADKPADDEKAAKSLEKSTEELHALIRRMGTLSLLSLEDLGAGYNHEGDILDCIKDPKAEDPMAATLKSELRSRIVEVLEALPKRERLVITLYYYEELTLKEIGTVLGTCEGRVCQLLKEILQRLKIRLKGCV